MKNKSLVLLIIGLVTCVFACPSWCGSEWLKMNSGTNKNLTDIWGNSANDVYVVGSYGTILHYDGNNWSAMDSGTEEYLSSVWSSSANDVFAVLETGTILHYDGSNWSTMISGIDKYLSCVWGSSANDVFVVGSSGTILHYDGNNWTTMNSGTDGFILNVWGRSANDVFAVGAGIILHYDGSNWNTMDSGNSHIIYGVWSSSANDVFAVCRNGDILHYDGSNWSTMIIGTDDDESLYGVGGSSANDVYAVGDSGNILHYDGSTWSKMNSRTINWFEDVWATTSKVFCIGSKGTILYRPLHCDLVLKDANGDQLNFYLGNSQNQGYSFYYGSWVSNGAEYDCTLVYNQFDKTITINADYKDNQTFYYALKYDSPSFFNGYYTLYNTNKPFTETYMQLIEGEFATTSAAKISQRNSEHPQVTPQQDNTLKLGALIPISGELQSLGDAFAATLMLAQQDANTYLNNIGSELTVELFTEDNQANPGQTWHSIQSLREQGVAVFLGPQDSPSLDYIKQFADEEDYLLLSSSSTAAEISIPDDNVMRCISDDNLQAAALIDKMKADGIEDIIIVSRTNIYGHGFYQSLERGWIANNETTDHIIGDVIEDATDVNTAVTILFSRPDTDIPDTLEYLKNMLSEDEFSDKSKTAVVLIAYDEGAALMEQASTIEGLGDLRWYGTDSLAQNNTLISNPAAAEFAAKTNFTCTTFAIPESEAYNAALEKVTTMLGHTPPALAMIAYDSYQLAVRAYIEAGSNDPASMKTALQNVAETYEGITGDLSFNANGDRANGAYEYWTLTQEDGLYYWQSDSGQVWTGDPVLIREWSIFE